jgi:hypothetical protein
MKKAFLLFIFFLASFITARNFSSKNAQVRAPSSTTLKDIGSGIPKLSGNKLDPISYVPLETHKLKNARVLWINFDLLRENGIEIPAEGLTPDFEKQFLDEFAFMAKSDKDNADFFLEEQKTLYADRYGGMGVGRNWGSGRAGSAGVFQTKGSGVTSLVGDGQVFDHAHGGASIIESIQEAIWGEVNHHELPFGSNRILAIIDTGTSTEWADGTRESRSLIIREDPLRPAHFLLSFHAKGGEFAQTEAERIQKNFRKFLYALPLPEAVDRGTLKPKEILKMGLEEFVDRITQQYAAANARRIFHGGASPSNIDLSGKFLDFGTETTLSDFGKAKVLDIAKAFDQEVTEHVINTLSPLLSMVKAQMKTYLAEALKSEPTHAQMDVFMEEIPTLGQLQKRLNEKFSHYQNIEYLNLLGIPAHLNKKLGSSSSAVKLGELLVEVAFSSQENFNVDKSMPEKMGIFPTSEIFKILSTFESNDANKLDDEIGIMRLSSDLRKKLATSFIEYRNLAMKEANKEGVSNAAFYRYQKAQAIIKNKDAPDLYRSNLREKNIELVDQYKLDHDRSKIWESIDQKIENSRQTYKELSPYEVVLNSQYDHLSGEVRHLLFNAKKNKTLLKIISPLIQDQFYFFKNRISLVDRSNLPLMIYSENAWKSKHEVSGRVINGHVEFEIPVKNNAQQIQFLLRSANGKTMWKNGNQDGFFKIESGNKLGTHQEDCKILLKAFFSHII